MDDTGRGGETARGGGGPPRAARGGAAGLAGGAGRRAEQAAVGRQDGAAEAARAATGACTINRSCAQQYVGKSQSCMVISGRLIVHAPVLASDQRTCQRFLRVCGRALLQPHVFC